MCMTCNNTGKPLKKIILILAMAVGIGAIIYFVFTATNNPVFAASIPLILSFAACPLMCVVMGGFMWIKSRNKKNSNVIKEKRVVPSENSIEPQPVEHKQSVVEWSHNEMERQRRRYSQWQT